MLFSPQCSPAAPSRYSIRRPWIKASTLEPESCRRHASSRASAAACLPKPTIPPTPKGAGWAAQPLVVAVIAIEDGDRAGRHAGEQAGLLVGDRLLRAHVT